MDEHSNEFNKSLVALYEQELRDIRAFDFRISNHRKKMRGKKVKRTRKKLDYTISLLNEWHNQLGQFAYSLNNLISKKSFDNLQKLEIMTAHFLESNIGIKLD